MRPHPARRRPFVPQIGAAALLALGGLACSDGPLAGPGLPGRGASLRLEPRVEARASVVATDIARVHVAIARIPDGLVVIDSVVDLVGPAGAELDLAVPLASSTDRFLVRLAAADAAGDTIFRAVDTTEVVRGSAAPSLELMLRYAGPDTGLTHIAAGRDTIVVDPGASVSLWAVGYRPAASGPVPLAHVSWRSADEAVVRVSRTGGRATAIAAGRATWVYVMTATGLVDSTHVVVRHAVATLQASPASLSLVTGALAPVTVAGVAPDGTVLPPAALSWTSSDPSVAAVDADGVVAAVGVGSTMITATSGGAQVAVPVAVGLPPVVDLQLAPATMSLVRLARAQLVATPRLADGTVARDRLLAWTTSDASVATVGGDGTVSAVGVGVATVTAAIDGRSASAEVEVAPLPPSATVVSPSTVQIIAGGSFTLAATVTDGAGDPLPNTPIAWSSSSPGVALVSSAGHLIAVAPGQATVTASAAGMTSTVAVTVLPVPVASVRLSSGARALVVGQTLDFDATPLAADGTPLPDRAVTWTSSSSSIGTVSSNGVVTAVAPGFTIVTATSEGVESSVKVDVAPIPVATVTLSASAVSLREGGTFQLRADAHDSLGRLLPGRPVSWWSDAPSIATVANDGLVTAWQAGLATVTASVDGKVATATVTVVLPSAILGSVALTPSSFDYAYGQTLSGMRAQLSPSLAPATVSLSSSDTTVATVQASVVAGTLEPAWFTVTGRALGPVTITGSAAGFAAGTAIGTVREARLRAVGWSGVRVREGEFIRVRFEAAGALGTATDAVFAERTPIRILFDKQAMDVHLDAYPDRDVGPASSDDRASSGSIGSGDPVYPVVGRKHFTLLVEGKRAGKGSLSLVANGKYVRLDLQDLIIDP